MIPPGYVEYKKRTFCKDVKCPIQLKLNELDENSDEYQEIRKTCTTACKYTTWQFHHWLIENGYLVIKPIKE
ncbi:MAG: hypothetical protein ACTSQY_03835 [Candidatus Odinarchaeia archaeon]